MRIEFLTQDDPLYIFPFFDEFLCHYGNEFEIIQISSSRAMGKRSRVQLLRELVCLYGFFGFLRLGLQMAVTNMLGRLPKKRSAKKFYTLAQLCRAYGIPYVKIGNPNAVDFVSAARQRAPDVIVSVACPYILKEGLLTVPLHKCVNIHHAPLPRYKGMMPTFWQMFYGERVVGLTIHYMAPKVDEGAALMQEELPIEPNETLHHLIRRSKRHGAHCMARALRQVQTGYPPVLTLEQKGGSYFTFPTFAEIHEFYQRGLNAI